MLVNGNRLGRTAVLLFAVSWQVAVSGMNGEGTSRTVGTIGGVVIDIQTGRSVANVTVKLLPMYEYGADAGGSLTARSGPSGLFRFSEVPAQEYAVSVNAPGYLQSVLDTAMDGIVVTPGDSIRDLVVNIHPESSIQGQVLNRDGDGAAGASVRAFVVSPKGIREVSQGRTDTLGRFIVSRLPPGHYTLRAETTEPPFNQAPAYYPALPVLSATPVIAVGWGEHVTGIRMDFPRDPAYRIRGQVEDWLDTLSDDRAEVHLAPFSEHSFDLTALACRTPLEPDRSFQFKGVPSGLYTVRLMHLASHRTLAKQTVTVGTTDVVSLVLRPEPPISIAGQLTASRDRRTDLSWSRVTFLPVPSSVGSARAVEAISGNDGRFRAEDLEPITYALLVQAPPGLYVDRIQVNGSKLSGRYLDLADGIRGKLNIQLRAGAASITGKVRETGETLMHEGRLRVAVLYPAESTPSAAHLKVSSTAGGEFRFAGITPGRYRILVTDRFEPQWFSDTRFVAQLSGAVRTVEIRPYDRQRLELWTISAAQVATAARRAGFSWF